jgi:hypothetical protein
MSDTIQMRIGFWLARWGRDLPPDAAKSLEDLLFPRTHGLLRSHEHPGPPFTVIPSFPPESMARTLNENFQAVHRRLFALESES